MNRSITVSFRPAQIKYFKSTRRFLLLIDGICVNGYQNHIFPGDRAVIHLRPHTFLYSRGDKNEDKTNIDLNSGTLPCEVESVIHALIASIDLLQFCSNGAWVNADTTKIIVVTINADIERNRKGTRVAECRQLLCIQQKGDASYIPIDNDDVCKKYIIHSNDMGYMIGLKSERHEIFAYWLVNTYGKDLLAQGSGVIDAAGGNGMIARTLVNHFGIPSTLLDPKPRCTESLEDGNSFRIIPYALTGEGFDLTRRNDDIGAIVNNCSFICGLHPDQATEPIVSLALRQKVPFAVAPCCVMPSLFPNRVQKRHGDPVRSYSAFCQYILDMAPEGEKFQVIQLPFVGRNNVIFSKVRDTKQ